jgi:hypothetical protein
MAYLQLVYSRPKGSWVEGSWGCLQRADLRFACGPGVCLQSDSKQALVRAWHQAGSRGSFQLFPSAGSSLTDAPLVTYTASMPAASHNTGRVGCKLRLTTHAGGSWGHFVCYSRTNHCVLHVLSWQPLLRTMGCLPAPGPCNRRRRGTQQWGGGGRGAPPHMGVDWVMTQCGIL